MQLSFDFNMRTPHKWFCLDKCCNCVELQSEIVKGTRFPKRCSGSVVAYKRSEGFPNPFFTEDVMLLESDYA